MTDTPHIDDRRRFKELWKELVYARVLIAALAGALYGHLIELAPPWFWQPVGQFAVWAVLLAVPVAVARKGWRVPVIVTVACLVGEILFEVVVQQVDVSSATLCALLAADYATGFGAIGVIEGMSEKSIATIWCGILGGIIGGVAASAWFDWYAWYDIIGGPGPLLVMDARPAVYSGIFVIGHLSIALALVLGRWIRDLPKRKLEQAEPTE